MCLFPKSPLGRSDHISILPPDLILDKHSVTSNCSQNQNCCLCKMSQEELELSFPSPCNKGTNCFVYEDIVIT